MVLLQILSIPEYFANKKHLSTKDEQPYQEISLKISSLPK